MSAPEPVVCSAERARELVDSIRSHVALAKDALVEAWRSRAWVPLGFESWDSMCDAEFGVRVQLPREERRELVGELRQEGMSTRAIGSALGINNATAARDLSSSVADATDDEVPARVVSLDGRERPATQPPKREQISVEEFIRRDPAAAQRIDEKRFRARWSQDMSYVADVPLLDVESAASVLAEHEINHGIRLLEVARQQLDQILQANRGKAGLRLINNGSTS